jgi:hypothetical protein
MQEFDILDMLPINRASFTVNRSSWCTAGCFGNDSLIHSDIDPTALALVVGNHSDMYVCGAGCWFTSLRSHLADSGLSLKALRGGALLRFICISKNVEHS